MRVVSTVNVEKARVGVVIVNWNSFDVLKQCLDAIKAQSHKPVCVIVVDNGSDNASAELEGDLPDNTHYVRLNSNMGFAHANNLAVSQLKSCDWIGLINPDAFPRPDWLHALLAAARRRPEFSLFASMTLADQQPEYLDGTGDVYHISGIAWRRGYGRYTATARLIEEEVFAPCAAAALYRRDAWEEAGGFDEEFFCYFEDVDLAFRMRLLGHRCLFVPSAVARHIGAITSGGQQSDFSVYYGHRNLVWTYIKDMPGYAFWLFLPAHIAMNFLSVCWFVASGRWRVILRAKVDAIRGIPNAWRKRRVIQAKRKVSVAEIVRTMDKRVIPIRRPGDTLEVFSSSARRIAGDVADGAAMRDAEYFSYLRHRSLSGLLYRRFWLYPRLSRDLQDPVLDVGCGIGDFVAYRRGSVGVDVNACAVSWCRRRGLDVRLMEEDRLPFADGSFNSVVLDNVLEHLSEPSKLLAEIRRVLAPGGKLTIGVPGTLGYASDPDHKKFYEESNLKQVLDIAGFSLRDVFFMPMKWKWLDRRLPQYCLYGQFERP